MNGDKQIEDTLARRAESILCEALDHDSAEERKAFMDTACGDDSALFGVVERLLAMEDEADAFFSEGPPLSVSVMEITQTLTDVPEFFENMGSVLPDDDEVGTQIGPYTLLQRIGEGGIGNVYLAQQEKPVRRQVALKIIKAGMDTRNVIARFEAERQALAMMEHPNIARVLNAGETETGRPYFVMELVHGVRITTFCDEFGLDICQRMKLFILVCRAIQHAHQKGVIHRDIKPSNVLVSMGDGVPVPCVIDFGIAKATGEHLLSDQTLFTARELVIGTPAYMSPEQAQMGRVDVDTRSDIYSLGVLLYELLAGKPPFGQKELLEAGLDEMRRTLLEREPLAPSVRFRKMSPDDQDAVAQRRGTEPRRLSAMLAGDLDWIVMKALEKDRARRYESADALAMDLGRFLNDEPVLARPPGRVYQLRKLIRRNRLVCAAGGAVLLALIAGLGISMWMYFRAEDARANENRLRIRAELRGKITQAALALNRGEPERAEGLVHDIPFEVPSIEGAAVLRQLMRWHVLQGEPKNAVRYVDPLLKTDLLNDLEAQSLDFLMSSAVLSVAGDQQEYSEWVLNRISRLDANMPPSIRARAGMAALLRPIAGDSVLNQLQRLGFAESNRGDSSDASAEKDAPASLWPRLQLVGCGGVTPHQITNDGGLVTFIAGGEDIVRSHDSFEFAYMTVAGDFDLCLRVHSIEWLDDFTRIGLMVRNHLEAPGSRQMMIAVNAGNTFQVMVRSHTGSETASLPPGPLPATHGSNSWVRLQRVGSVFRGYTSSNGKDWLLLDAYDSAIGPDGPFSDSTCVGIAACAHHPQNTAVAVISDFQFVSAPSVEMLMATALLQYRLGAPDRCEHLCRRALMYPEINSGQAAIIRSVLSMALGSRGHRLDAREQYRQAEHMIEARFALPLDAGHDTQNLWFDWIIARTLLIEAESVLF